MCTKGYFKEFEVHYYQIDRHQEATPVALLNFLEETAISHSEHVGLSIDRLKSDGLAWVLNRWSLSIDRYPLLNEKIIVETWPSDFERFHATRQFRITDEYGNVIVKCASLWILFDLAKRRPVRIPEAFGKAYGIMPYNVMESPFSKFKSVSLQDHEIKFMVRRSDIDTNNHVNNVSYLEWMLEAVPQEVYDKFRLSALEIIYKKETRYGMTVSSGCICTHSTDNILEFTHSISNTEEQAELAVARTVWEKRQTSPL